MSRNAPLEVVVLAVGPLQCNCSIVYDPASRTGMVFDPGGNGEEILAIIRQKGLTIVGIVHTHGHTDHVLASGMLKAATGAPIYLHRADEKIWHSAEIQCQMFGMEYEPIPDPDHWLSEEELLPLGGQVFHTPGHTPGGCCVYFADDRLLIAGDTLFHGSIGRTDLPGGSFQAIEESIRNKLYVLPDDVHVITGHGPETMLGYEKQYNPFVRP